MTKRERQQLEKAITHLMSDDLDGFTDGMDILLAMVGKKPFPKEGKVNPIWELNIAQAPQPFDRLTMYAARAGVFLFPTN